MSIPFLLHILSFAWDLTFPADCASHGVPNQLGSYVTDSKFEQNYSEFNTSIHHFGCKAITITKMNYFLQPSPTFKHFHIIRKGRADYSKFTISNPV